MLVRKEKKMKVEIIKRETIKPSSPTPHRLRNFKLSLLDQIAPLAYSLFVLFYPVVRDDDHNVDSTERSQRLKRSLSETLSSYFPLAGRIKDNFSIDCNDEGVAYFEARVHGRLEDFLGHHPVTKELKQLVQVDDYKSTESRNGCSSPMLVQFNFFECGGMAIGLSFSHKLIDAGTFSTFIKAWSATAAESGEAAAPPNFAAASLFPPKELPVVVPVQYSPSLKCVIKRILFDASNLACLKAKAASASVPQPTRVEVVSSLIWKCAIMASRSNSELSMVGQCVNLRKRIVPPLPENSLENLYWNFAAKTEKKDVELQSLVCLLRQGMIDFCNDYVSELVGENGVDMICESFKQAETMVFKDDVDFYMFTSWCRLHLYEAEFGWGKPTWVGLALPPYKNLVVLMDTRDGDGIEAYVSLNEEDMVLFERNPELLSFASAFNMGRSLF